jgi:hypothetical protein
MMKDQQQMTWPLHELRKGLDAVIERGRNPYHLQTKRPNRDTKNFFLFVDTYEGSSLMESQRI